MSILTNRKYFNLIVLLCALFTCLVLKYTQIKQNRCNIFMYYARLSPCILRAIMLIKSHVYEVYSTTIIGLW